MARNWRRVILPCYPRLSLGQSLPGTLAGHDYSLTISVPEETTVVQPWLKPRGVRRSRNKELKCKDGQPWRQVTTIALQQFGARVDSEQQRRLHFNLLIAQAIVQNHSREGAGIGLGLFLIVGMGGH